MFYHIWMYLVLPVKIGRFVSSLDYQVKAPWVISKICTSSFVFVFAIANQSLTHFQHLPLINSDGLFLSPPRPFWHIQTQTLFLSIRYHWFFKIPPIWKLAAFALDSNVFHPISILSFYRIKRTQYADMTRMRHLGSNWTSQVLTQVHIDLNQIIPLGCFSHGKSQSSIVGHLLVHG